MDCRPHLCREIRCPFGSAPYIKTSNARLDARPEQSGREKGIAHYLLAISAQSSVRSPQSLPWILTATAILSADPTRMTVSTLDSMRECYTFIAYVLPPVKSMRMHGSFPMTHASWPGGISTASPVWISADVPSSMRTFIRPDKT
jgi:hypothetical protein